MEIFTMDEIFIKFFNFAKIGFQKCSRNWIFDFLRGGSLRARMTNSGNERKIYSAHFDSYVGFQNDVKNCLNTFKNFSWT